MTNPEFDPKHDAADATSVFSRALWSFQIWAETPVGRWVLIGLFGVGLLTAIALAIVLPRSGEPADSITAADAELPAPPALLADVTHLTLAPNELQDMSFDDARAWNAALPYSQDRPEMAPRFVVPTADIASYGRALDCMTAAIYYEAGAETSEGQAAVAQVILNRMRHPAYPHSVCGVVFQGSDRVTGCQFTFTCDGALRRSPAAQPWARARLVATAALNGMVAPRVGMATHYHTDWVAPYWAPRLSKITKIGTHIFYRWAGTWGRKVAFTSKYAESEPLVAKMTPLSTLQLTEEPVLTEPTIEETVAIPVVVPAELRISPSSVVTPVLPVAPQQPAADQPIARPQERPTPVLADPLAPPGPQPRRQPRVAMPSNW